MLPRVIVAARAVVYINGKLYSKVTGFRWNSSTPLRAIHGIDNPVAYELAPTVARMTGTMALIRTSGDGGLEGPGITAQFADIPRQKYFTLLLLDRATDTVLFRADQCMVSGQSWDLPVKGLMTGTLDFEGIVWSNEVGPAP